MYAFRQEYSKRKVHYFIKTFHTSFGQTRFNTIKEKIYKEIPGSFFIFFLNKTHSVLSF